MHFPPEISHKEISFHSLAKAVAGVQRKKDKKHDNMKTPRPDPSTKLDCRTVMLRSYMEADFIKYGNMFGIANKHG